MSFEFICNNKGIVYPIGHNMSYNKSAMNNMVKILKTLYMDPKKNLVFWTAGSSGPIIASYVGSKLKNNFHINHIKPKGVFSHSTIPIYGKSHIHIFIDDFIEDGKTFKMVYKEAKKRNVVFDCFCLSKTLHLRCIDFIPRVIIAGTICSKSYTYYYKSQTITL